jgi:hypothetical protein
MLSFGSAAFGDLADLAVFWLRAAGTPALCQIAVSSTLLGVERGTRIAHDLAVPLRDLNTEFRRFASVVAAIAGVATACFENPGPSL